MRKEMKTILMLAIIMIVGLGSIAGFSNAEEAAGKVGLYTILSDSDNRAETITSWEAYRYSDFSLNFGYAISNMVVGSVDYDLPFVKTALKKIPVIRKVFEVELIDEAVNPSAGMAGSVSRLGAGNEFEYGITFYGLRKTIKF